VNAFDSTSGRGSRTRLYALLVDWLSRPAADSIILILGIVLLLPCLDTGLAADDYLQTIMLDRPSPIPGFARSPFDIFRFCDPSHFGALLDEGIYSWWDDPATKLGFMRPLTSLTHAFDHAFFRNSGFWMHLHSVLWAALLLLGVRAFYRALLPDRLVANLAFALYALDDARGWLVSWVAARNAAVATAFSVWTLVAHHLERSGRLRTRRLLGPLMLALALLAGEGSIATCGYLLAYALCLETGAWSRRLLGLWRYGVVLVIWRIAYRALDYGVYGSSLYVDPTNAPLAYLKMLIENGPILLAAQLGGIWSDVWNVMFLVPIARVVLYIASLGAIGFLAWVIRPAYRRSPELRFAALGGLLSLLPASAVFPADRLLTWLAVGASIVLAIVLAPVLRGEPPIPIPLRLTAAALVAIHLISVPFLPSRARGNLVMRNGLDRSDGGVPRDPDVVDKTLVFVNPPALPIAAYLPLERAGRGVPRPHRQHILAIGVSPLTIERLDPNTLRLTPRGGFLLDPLSKLLWSDERPFRVGEQIVQGDMTVSVRAITADRRPAAVDMHFARPLEDQTYLWRDWQGSRPGPFTPPALGQSVTLPGADYLQVALGYKLPFELRL
jgi:hypothetical protein